MKFRKEKKPLCPGCLTNGYVSRHKAPTCGATDWWCGRCSHWFKADK